MRTLWLISLACMAPLSFAQSTPSFADYGPLVRRDLVDGRPRLTVIAEDSPTPEVLRMIAQQYELELVGLENVANTLVNAHLEGRDLNSILTVILGSLNMQHQRHGSVLEIMPIPSLDSDELFARADSAWLDFYRRFPTHPMAPHAQFSRAEIKEKVGNLSAARELYMKLVKDYPLSLEMGPALLRAGQLSSKQGDIGQAAQIFRDLAALDVSNTLQTAARVDLARVLITQGDPQQALNLLRSMEVGFPALDQGEATVRRLIRARALNKLGKFVDALREIDLLDENFDDLAAWESFYIRAIAMDGMGLHADAAQYWLAYADGAIGKDRAEAYASAARLALLANDEMAVFFIAEAAKEAGFEKGILIYVEEARQRLGLTEVKPESELDKTLTELESWIDAGEILRAMETLSPIFKGRIRMLELDLKARTVVAWARCIEDQDGLEQAIAILHAERQTFNTGPELGLLDIVAASLFEKHSQFLEATKAYQGEYGQ